MDVGVGGTGVFVGGTGVNVAVGVAGIDVGVKVTVGVGGIGVGVFVDVAVGVGGTGVGVGVGQVLSAPGLGAACVYVSVLRAAVAIGTTLVQVTSLVPTATFINHTLAGVEQHQEAGIGVTSGFVNNCIDDIAIGWKRGIVRIVDRITNEQGHSIFTVLDEVCIGGNV